MARALRSAVDRDNMFVKIPATPEGLSAITQVTSEGISVNVTLIFALARYRAVMDAYLSGLEQAAADGRDLAAIRSVASFFISRVDFEVDARLDRLGTSQATQLKGKAAIANARLAYQAYEEVITSQRWQKLAGLGAQPQRPLWASTGVKNPAYPDTKYVTELVAADTVNTMPGTTLAAFADHGEVTGNTIRGRYHDARRVLDHLATIGVDFENVTGQLEREGLRAELTVRSYGVDLLRWFRFLWAAGVAWDRATRAEASGFAGGCSWLASRPGRTGGSGTGRGRLRRSRLLAGCMRRRCVRITRRDCVPWRRHRWWC
jgi:transaldolase